jgi:hypothetical protein
MRFYWLTLGVLGVWRVTHLLHAEDGPRNMLVALRRALGHLRLGGLMDCFYCLSLWVAVPFAWVIGQSWYERLLLWPALSGGAILGENLGHAGNSSRAAEYLEDKEDGDVLWAESNSSVSGDRVAPGC